MNICLVSIPKISPLNGGVENVCYNLAQHLANTGTHKIYSLYVKKDQSTPECPKVEYHTLPAIQECMQHQHIEALHHFLEERDIDIIWVHTPTTIFSDYIKAAAEGTLAKIVSIYHSSPYSILREIGDRHDLAFYRFRYHREIAAYICLLIKLPLSYINAYRKTRKLLQSLLRTSNVVSLLSPRYIDEFTRLSGCRDKIKLSSVTNPVLTSEFAYNPKKKKNQLLVVCRHEWKNKRLDRILRIWKAIQHIHPDWQLVILGDGPAHQEYREYADKLKLQRIYFKGKQKPDPYYAESKIICMTSSWEGLPMVLLEAQRYGCVPIAYESFSALRDIIIPGETGFCIPPFKQIQFIQALHQLMQDDNLWLQMARRNVEHASQFDISKIVTKWLSIFQSLTSKQQ